MKYASIPAPSAIYGRTFWLIAAGWLVASLIVYFTARSQPPKLIIGFVLSTIFQQSVLAAAWAALGPGKLHIRMPMSFGWACLMGGAIGLPLLFAQGELEGLLIFLLMMAGLWLAALMPLGAAALVFGLRLRHQGTEVPADEHKQRQFGIGQLLAFTTFVAVLLGGVRLLMTSGWFRVGVAHELPFMIFLLVTQIVISLPLIFATLLPKRAVAGSAVCVLFMIFVTLGEVPLGDQVMRISGGPRGELDILPWLNLFSGLWVIAFAVVARSSGYHFGVPDIVPDIQILKTTTAEPMHLDPPPTSEGTSGRDVLFIPE